MIGWGAHQQYDQNIVSQHCIFCDNFFSVVSLTLSCLVIIQGNLALRDLWWLLYLVHLVHQAHLVLPDVQVTQHNTDTVLLIQLTWVHYSSRHHIFELDFKNALTTKHLPKMTMCSLGDSRQGPPGPPGPRGKSECSEVVPILGPLILKT